MRDLFQGIMTTFNSTPHSSFYDKIGGRLYPEEAPQGTQYPYAVYGLVSNTADENWHTKYENTTIDFALYSDNAGAAEIVQMHEALKEQFDNANPSVSGYDLIHFYRENSWLNKSPTEIPNKSIWQYTIQYNVLTRKTT